jgi:hypothetical protein
MDEYFLSRRQLFAGLGVTAAGLIAGCAQAAPAAARSMTVYRDPGCGCCLNWVALARRAGFAVRMVDSQNIMAIKRQAGVPQALAACHTAISGNFVGEGHVPLELVRRLLDRPVPGMRGVAVAGMPVGSPGMESPSGAHQAFDVFTFDRAGRTTLLRRYPA